MKDEDSATSNTRKKDGGPNTGDSYTVYIWAGVAVLSLILFVIILLIRRKRGNN